MSYLSALLSENAHFCSGLKNSNISFIAFKTFPSTFAQTTPAGHQHVALLNRCNLGITENLWTLVLPWPLRVCRALGGPRHSAELRTEHKLYRLESRHLTFWWRVTMMSYKTSPCSSFHWVSKHSCLCRCLCLQRYPLKSPEWLISTLHYFLTHLYTHTAPLELSGLRHVEEGALPGASRVGLAARGRTESPDHWVP